MPSSKPHPPPKLRSGPDDVIIAVFGPTGSGKSTLISRLTGYDGIAGHKLKSFTTKVQAIRSKQRPAVVFIDTPGFDDTHTPDTEILKMIAAWLTKTYKDGQKIAGLIYLHRISGTTSLGPPAIDQCHVDRRYGGSQVKNLRMFGKLCGNIALTNVMLVTTMWDSVEPRTGEMRQKELETTFWKPMLDHGCTAAGLYGKDYVKHAWDLVDSLIAKTRIDKVLLQDELVNLRMGLNETEAGRAIYADLQRLIVEQRKIVRELRTQVSKEENQDLASELKVEYEGVNAKLRETFQQVDEMRIPFLRRFLLLFSKKSQSRAV